MEKSSEFVPALESRYVFKNGHLVFFDGTEYSLSEALCLTDERLSVDDLKAIHLVKKMFGGEIEGGHANGKEFRVLPVYESKDKPEAVQQDLFSTDVARRGVASKAPTLEELSKQFGDLPFVE